MKHLLIFILLPAVCSTPAAAMTLHIVDNGNGTVGILNSAYSCGDEMWFALVTDGAPYPSGGYVTDCAPPGTEIGPPGILQMIWPPPGPDGVWGFIGDAMCVSTPSCVSINGITAPIGATVKLYKINDDLSVTLLDSRIVSSKPEDMDYGDCPEPYPTLLADNGARHGSGDPNLYLGNSVDLEPDGQPTPDANGDDVNGVPDDEDGVFFLTDIRRGKPAGFKIIASKQGLLDAWLDFNADGDFNDPGEHILPSFPLNRGSNIIIFNVPVLRVPPIGPPSSYEPLSTYARFRFSSTGGLGPNGPAEDGEVEDYRVRVWQECLYGGNAGANEYADWVEWGRPDCWCYPRQCRGDADGSKKLGIQVSVEDLTLFRAAYSKNNAQMPPSGICADLDHKPKLGMRVTVEDLTIFRTYYTKPTASVPPCDQPPIYTGPYHFWTDPPKMVPVP